MRQELKSDYEVWQNCTYRTILVEDIEEKNIGPPNARASRVLGCRSRSFLLCLLWLTAQSLTRSEPAWATLAWFHHGQPNLASCSAPGSLSASSKSVEMITYQYHHFPPTMGQEATSLLWTVSSLGFGGLHAILRPHITNMQR